MPSRFTLILVDSHGARAFELPGLLLRGLPVLGLVTVSLAALAVVLGLAMGSWSTAAEQAGGSTPRDAGAPAPNSFQLAGLMDAKASDIAKLTEKIRHIESRLGLEPIPGHTLAQRVELARLMLAPSGADANPLCLKADTAPEPPEHSPAAPPLPKPVSLTQSPPNQKQVMLAAIPNGFPVPSGEVTSGFGRRIHPNRGDPAFHSGVDLLAPMGTRVRATADSVVEFAGVQTGSGFGRLVILRHAHGFRTYYGHLDRILVEPGAFVERGQPIATSGNSGQSVGPHLHYEVHFIDHILNPENFLAWDLQHYDRIFLEKQVKWESLIALINKRLTSQTPQSLQLALK
ncbi:MAG: M23 family metallopeptidase [Magnetococcales bacterium]|nr:M23 family metallopeptidase [Magnetococcales bacterium]